VRFLWFLQLTNALRPSAVRDISTDNRPVSAPPLDLSKSPNLQYVDFVVGEEGVEWTTMTLQTSIPPNLRKIAVYLRGGSSYPTERTVLESNALDCLLAKLWTSHSVLPRIVYRTRLEMVMQRLFPVLARSGAGFEAWIE